MILTKIKSLWHHIDKLYSGEPTKISREEVNLLVEIYKEVMPGTRLNTGCGDCLKYALAVCASYYEREMAKQPLVENISPDAIRVEPDEVTTKVEEEVIKEEKVVKKSPIKKPVKKAIRKK